MPLQWPLFDKSDSHKGTEDVQAFQEAYKIALIAVSLLQLLHDAPHPAAPHAPFGTQLPTHLLALLLAQLSVFVGCVVAFASLAMAERIERAAKRPAMGGGGGGGGGSAVPASSSRPSSRPGSRPASCPGSRPSSRAGLRAASPHASPPVSPEHEHAYGYGHSARPAGGGARPRRWQRRRMDSDELLAQARRDRAEIFYISISASCT